jgi:shikimate kinase
MSEKRHKSISSKQKMYLRVVLIGFRGVGKTTVGKRLAKMLNWKFLSTDVLIEKLSGQNISYLVESKGWKNFRNFEMEVIRALKDETKVVIDCGGGVVENSENITMLSPGSLMVWVDAELKDIFNRLSNAKDRPLLSQSNLEEDIVNNYNRRFPLYQYYSHLYVNSSEFSEKDICNKIKGELTK